MQLEVSPSCRKDFVSSRLLILMHGLELLLAIEPFSEELYLLLNSISERPWMQDQALTCSMSSSYLYVISSPRPSI